jgi:hypothetical protein
VFNISIHITKKRCKMTTINSLAAFVDKDVLASLMAYFEEGTTPNPPISHADITVLWEACWDVWWACDPMEHLEFGAFMASVKAAYPSLPGKPSGAVVFDPENL